ncbi:MAG: OmpA family protein [Sulfurimonadaceae bacterium]
MKALLYASTLTAMLVFTGCTGSGPTVDDSAATASQAEEISIVDESSAADAESGIQATDLDSGSMTLESIEAKMSPIYFGFDLYKLADEDVDTLRQNVELVKGDAEAMNIADKYSLKLEGNCDEWGSDEYNFALGLKRANAVKDELINDGIAAERITMVSYGSSNPVCTEKTQECWSKNRRVDFKLLP